MGGFMKKVRGILGTGISWAVGWTGAGVALHALFRAFDYAGFIGITLLGDVAIHAAMGFLGGAIFATGFVLTEGGRRLGDLRLGGGAVWGAVAGLLAPTLVLMLGFGSTWGALTGIWPLFLGTGLFGAGSGTLMTAVARASARGSLSSGAEEGRDLASIRIAPGVGP